MKIIVKKGMLRCGHDGSVVNEPSQQWVRVTGSPVLVQPDPRGRSINGCPNIGLNIKPCKTTLVVQKGYSTFLRIGGRGVCLDTVEGYTDGTPPGAVKYTVRSPGQEMVEAST
ncbi:hypothetical protein [Cryobacterium psychrophilum]|uniref:Uncharacterized protein n=1 Tax=Cryobacterium psychrophilum TaxID=41988 RepID=A0A4Y8KKH8_9MICO|nr:hypothetical protein [Cryobacterium psychrophilum]TDW30880.1 hypothetical protein EDD25_2659 [Cryobacterium psychrophilum]TFD75732.1 hypothetical protein E3T53_14715 [Cryobacterium psychrophilum]